MISRKQRLAVFLVALLAGATCQPTPGEVLVARALGRAQSVPDAGVVSEVEGAQGGADAEEVTKVDKAPTDPDAEEVDEEDKSQDDPNAGEVSVVEEAQGHPDSDYYEDVAEVESSQIDPDGGDVGEEEEAQDDQNVRVVPEDRTEKVGDSEDRTGEVALIDPDPDARLAAETSRTHLHQFHKGIIIKQLLTILFTAFISSITTTIVNWFFPFKVVPPIPGRLGVGQLFGGFLPKYGYYPPPQFNGNHPPFNGAI